MAVVLCTGSEGFIGRHVVKRLMALGHDVIGIDSLDERAHPDDHGTSGAEFLVTNVGKVPETAFRNADVVIHLAAQVSVADSALNYVRYVHQNTCETAQFLMDLTNARVFPRLIVASSMSVYGEGGVRVSEDQAVQPASVYGLTKYDQETLCLLWGKQYTRSVAALRFFNVYGPGQCLTNAYTGVLANFANRLLLDEAPVVYEDGSQTRDFISVEDVADAVVTVALSEQACGGAYNVCTGEATSILHAARSLANALGKGDIEPHLTHETRVGDIRHCTGNPLKLAQHFGWHAKTPFALGIQEYANSLLAAR